VVKDVNLAGKAATKAKGKSKSKAKKRESAFRASASGID